MSGFEIAGIVLGAFPLAIMALESYHEVAKRIHFFHMIRIEHKKCMINLGYQQVFLTTNLRRLILPLAVDYNDARIEALLSDPGGPGWKDTTVAAKLINRLKGSYEVYLSCILGIQLSMEELNRELATHLDAIQDHVQQSSARGFRLRTNEDRQFQLFRFNFCNGEKKRDSLFSNLQDYNTKLQNLLKFSDKDARLTEHITRSRMSAIDTAVCTFWKQATRVYRTLSTAWACRCHQQYYAKLQLQHRTTAADLTILFETVEQSPLTWKKRRARISEKMEQLAAQSRPHTPTSASQPPVPPSRLPIRVPSPSPGAVAKSAMKTKGPSRPSTVGFLIPPASTVLAQVPPPTQNANGNEITSLCLSLQEVGRNSCCGYLTRGDYRYYVHREAHESHDWQTFVTLKDVLEGQVTPQPTRRQRFTISLVVASSLVQLLDTPWMPGPLYNSDIIFFQDAHRTGAFTLDQPHIAQQFADTVSTISSSSPIPPGPSLNRLGILLLELCFGTVLGTTSYRKSLQQGETETEWRTFDIMAAKLWQEYVEDEAGHDYSHAVKWCLKADHDRHDDPSRWRKDMLSNVIQPLQRCKDYLEGKSGCT